MTYDMSQYIPGDRLCTRYTYWHEGIYVGPKGPTGESIAHNSPDRGMVVLSHPEDFAHHGRPIYFVRGTPEDQRDMVVGRAMQLLGVPFDLLTFNCQHFANYAQDGAAVSPRVSVGAVGIGITVCSLLALLVAGRPDSAN